VHFALDSFIVGLFYLALLLDYFVGLFFLDYCIGLFYWTLLLDLSIERTHISIGRSPPARSTLGSFIGLFYWTLLLDLSIERTHISIGRSPPARSILVSCNRSAQTKSTSTLHILNYQQEQKQQR
jgi:hypothetical protein